MPKKVDIEKIIRYAEMFGAFAKGIVGPKGDRIAQGSIPIDETIKQVLK